MVAISGRMEVTLTRIEGSDVLAIPQRVLSFTGPDSAIRVGRASLTPSKQLQAARDNCWIDNSVLSRQHAVFTMGTDQDSTTGSGSVPKLALYLTDDASRHDTRVNGKRIRGKGRVTIQDSDKVQFGDAVPKDKELYKAPVFTVQIKTFHDEPQIEPPTVKPLRFAFPTRSPGTPAAETTVLEPAASKIAVCGTSACGSAFGLPEEDMSEYGDSEFNTDESYSSWSPSEAIEQVEHLHQTDRHDPPFKKPVGMLGLTDTIMSKEDSAEASNANDLKVVEDSMSFMAQPYKEEENCDSQLPFYEDVESYFTGDDEEVDSGAKTPDGTPHVPFLTKDFSLAAYDGQLLSSVTLLPAGDPEPSRAYTDGPFVQDTHLDSLDLDDTRLYNDRPTHSSSWLHESETEHRKASTITKSTQDILDSNRSSEDASVGAMNEESKYPPKHAVNHVLETKKEMSISSLMNPEKSANSNKRKAADFEQDDSIVVQAARTGKPAVAMSKSEKADKAPETTRKKYNTRQSLNEADGQSFPETIQNVMVGAETQPVANPRPSKRLRTIATHTGTFALGAVSLLAGLMALPENYFT